MSSDTRPEPEILTNKKGADLTDGGNLAWLRDSKISEIIGLLSKRLW